MATQIETPAERIAGDLALAIHQGLIRAGEKLPSQSKLMDSYGVAMGTVSSALGKLQAAGLIRASVGVGTFAEDPDRLWHNSAVLDVMAAAAMCRSLAAITFGANGPTLAVGGSPDWDDPHTDPEKTLPPRMVDVSALAALDRHLLRWMSEAFLTAARRMVGSGQSDADIHLIASARAILRDGARRPDHQPGIAHMGGPIPDDEAVAFRIWPERRESLNRALAAGAPWGAGESEPPF